MEFEDSLSLGNVYEVSGTGLDWIDLRERCHFVQIESTFMNDFRYAMLCSVFQWLA